MKIYGYGNIASESPMELSEITISADPQMLREIATFLNSCADQIEQQGSEWEHEHFATKSADGDIPSLVVFNQSLHS